MADQRALDAIHRIEHALSRIESGAGRPPSPEDRADSEEFRRLREAHDALRSRVASAIGQIDRLIDVGEQR